MPPDVTGLIVGVDPQATLAWGEVAGGLLSVLYEYRVPAATGESVPLTATLRDVESRRVAIGNALNR